MATETPTERAAIVAIRLSQGARLTTFEVSQMTGLSRYGAYRMMARLSRVLPLLNYQGRWMLLSSLVDGADTCDE